MSENQDKAEYVIENDFVFWTGRASKTWTEAFFFFDVFNRLFTKDVTYWGVKLVKHASDWIQ